MTDDASDPPEVTKCAICGEPTAGVYELSKGCVCCSDRVQGLCPQHGLESEPLGTFTLIAVWVEDDA